MSGTTPDPASAPAGDPAAAAVVAPAAAPADPSTLLSGAKVDPAPAADPAKTPPAAPVIPETYEFKAPEGVEIAPAEVEGYQAVAKEIGLSQEQFDRLAAFHITKAQEAANAPRLAYETMKREWVTQVMADPDLGAPDGKSLAPEAARNAALAIDRFGGDDLRRALIMTGAGDNPAVVKAFVEMGKSLSLATKLDLGRPATATRKGNTFDDLAASLYGKQGA